MRISLLPHVCFALVCGTLLLVAGCNNPSSQNLDSLTVSVSPSNLSVGGAAILHATAHLSDGTSQDVSSGTTWTLSDSSLATVTNGALNAKAAGTVTVQAAYIEITPAGTSPAASSTSPVTLTGAAKVTITAAGTTNVPVITWATPADIPAGTALSSIQLNATANLPGTFTYTPAAGTVLPKGTQTLTALFTPSDNKTYSSAMATVQLGVGLAAPVITWATPAPIAVGTALGAAQLDATANVAGAFAYSPAAGTVLAAGTQTLTATFTPTDTTDYSVATAQVSLAVGSTSGGPTGPVGPTPVGCGGPTINLDSSMSTGTIQSQLYSAPNCSLVIFAAGTYNITTQLNIPCNNLQITGPVAATPTAVLAATYTGKDIFSYAGTCANQGAVTYLHFENTGAIFFNTGNTSNFTFEYNMVTNLPSGLSNNESESGIFFGGDLSTTINNILIEYNTFGDENSCTSVFATKVDEGGYCAGVLTSEGEVENFTAKYNQFIHVEEGIHINQLAAFHPGQPNSVCVSCDIEYNAISHWHRIGIEIQVSTPTNPILIEHNSLVDPVASSWGTFGVSMACCQSGYVQAVNGNDPGYLFDDNVLVSTLPIGSECPPIGVEFWGTGPKGTNSLVQGTFCNGYYWGYGGGDWAVNDNYICGPNFAALGGYVNNEEHQNNPPSQSGNVTSKTCAATNSVAPTISFSGGQVTLADTGENTGIWYTTDESTPVPGQGTAQLYSAPFTAASATVKAVGMWGSYNQPTSYPAGYGYVPSSVVTAATPGAAVNHPGIQVSSTANPAIGAATLQSLTITPSTPAVTIGGTIQLKALATMTDGSLRDVTAEVAWNSSDLRTVAVNSSGTFTGLASGQALLTGTWQGQQTAVLASSSVGDVDWSGPVVIHQGGTYSGNWQSTDPKTAAVTITTTAPVIIQDSHLRGAGTLISVQVPGADLTVRNSLGLALNAGQKGLPNGAFLEAGSPAHLDVENNYIEDVRDGVVVSGYSGSRSASETLVIRENRGRNLNGSLSDGAGGYLAGEGANRASSRFVVFENVQAVPGIDVGWNEMIDYPTHSLVSDVISIYRSSGTANGPIEVHDSYIQGAYPYKPAQDAYRGGGIKTDGRLDDSAENASAFTWVHDNQVVGTVSYGIAFSAGHDNVAANNRVISSGLLADGTKIAAQHVGLTAGPANATIYNNTMHDNLVGWTCWSSACTPGVDSVSNTILPGKQITRDTEEGEYLLWLKKTATAGIRVGPTF